MVQDQKTGCFRLPEGRHPVEGKMTRDTLYGNTGCIYSSQRGDGRKIEQSFQGELVRDSTKIMFSSGMDLVVELGDENVFESIEPTGTKKERGEFTKVVPFINERNKQLKNWVLHQGGMLVFQAHADISDKIETYDDDDDDELDMNLDAKYKLKLYTVLSPFTFPTPILSRRRRTTRSTGP
mmetsp:Transcript_14013/g.33649  ORF Transcript_14013/g.33649 Transcript_14013/m.33649 type:complete len:181 (-) Transcript_14013:1772-2314(-)